MDQNGRTAPRRIAEGLQRPDGERGGGIPNRQRQPRPGETGRRHGGHENGCRRRPGLQILLHDVAAHGVADQVNGVVSVPFRV